jgi:hypothetical protein
MLLLLPTRLLKPWSYYRLVANFETQADIRKFTTFIWEKISVRKQITREVWPRCTNKHTRRLARHSRMRWHTSTRQRESLKVQKDEEDQSAILTACVSRNRELLTWAITLILNDNNQFPKYSEAELLNFELCWLLPTQKSGSDVSILTLRKRQKLRISVLEALVHYVQRFRWPNR